MNKYLVTLHKNNGTKGETPLNRYIEAENVDEAREKHPHSIKKHLKVMYISHK